MQEKRYVIYRLLNTITGKSYVGLTSNFKQRKAKHLREIESGTHRNKHLMNSYRKYGDGVFKWFILESNLSKEQAIEAEIKWIAFYDSFNNGYNKTFGGETTPDNFGSAAIPITWNEIEFPSLSNAERVLGIDRKILRYWLSQGWACDDDVVGKAYPYVWEGQRFESIAAAARYADVDIGTMWRWNKKGYTCKADFPQTNYDKKAPIVWEGRTFDSREALAEYEEVTLQTVHKWLNRGYSCRADVPKKGDIQKTPIVWEGIAFESIKAAADYCGVKFHTMRERIAKRYTSVRDMKRRHKPKRK